jgi:predicted amidohydrolase
LYFSQTKNIAMIVASAQFCPVHEGVEENLDVHYRFIEVAAAHGVKLIAFPEMSITSYIRETANKHFFTIDDTRLEKLQAFADKYNISVIAGAPVKINNHLYIGSFVISPGRKSEVYTKQYLHGTENGFFSSSFDYDPLLEIDDLHVSPAICADIDHPEHAASKAKKGAAMYVPSIFFSPNGLHEAYELLGSYASTHQMNVLMSNFCGTALGMPAGGRSAFWNKNGELIGSMDDKSSGLLIASYIDDVWETKVISLL